MMDDHSAQSGYYQEIAAPFLKRRGGGLVLSPRDQAAIAAWEEKRIPLRVVLEGVTRTFDALKVRGRDTRSISLAFCDREVEAAFAQHRDRAAGRRQAVEAPPRTSKTESAKQEIAKALAGLPAGEIMIRPLLQSGLEALSVPAPDEAALERLEAAIEEALWAGATEAERSTAEAEARRALKGRTAAGLDDAARRQAVMAARARLRVPHVSLHYY
jgi:hypothetical protein